MDLLKRAFAETNENCSRRRSRRLPIQSLQPIGTACLPSWSDLENVQLLRSDLNAAETRHEKGRCLDPFNEVLLRGPYSRHLPFCRLRLVTSRMSPARLCQTSAHQFVRAQPLPMLRQLRRSFPNSESRKASVSFGLSPEDSFIPSGVLPKDGLATDYAIAGHGQLGDVSVASGLLGFMLSCSASVNRAAFSLQLRWKQYGWRHTPALPGLSEVQTEYCRRSQQQHWQTWQRHHGGTLFANVPVLLLTSDRLLVCSRVI